MNEVIGERRYMLFQGVLCAPTRSELGQWMGDQRWKDWSRLDAEIEAA